MKPGVWRGRVIYYSIACLVLAAAGCRGTRVTLLTPPPPREGAIPNHAVKMTPAEDPAPPILHSEAFDAPVPLPGDVNTAGVEDSPFITADGSTMYFFFTPDLSKPAAQQVSDGVTGIYSAEWQGAAWGNVRRVLLQSPGRAALDGCPFVLDDLMWFCTVREGYEGILWFTARFTEGVWGNWQPVGAGFPPRYEVGELHISADGSELYFHSARAGGMGNLDLWRSRRVDGTWVEPENLGTLNSPEDDSRPYLTADGAELWFTRTYRGAPAVYRSMRTGNTWAEPELIISQLAGEPTLDRAGNVVFVHHYFKGGNLVEADLYIAYRR